MAISLRAATTILEIIDARRNTGKTTAIIRGVENTLRAPPAGVPVQSITLLCVNIQEVQRIGKLPWVRIYGSFLRLLAVDDPMLAERMAGDRGVLLIDTDAVAAIIRSVVSDYRSTLDTVRRMEAQVNDLLRSTNKDRGYGPGFGTTKQPPAVDAQSFSDRDEDPPFRVAESLRRKGEDHALPEWCPPPQSLIDAWREGLRATADRRQVVPTRAVPLELRDPGVLDSSVALAMYEAVVSAMTIDCEGFSKRRND